MIQPLNYYSRVVTGFCNCITEASSSSIRIFFNPQLFLSGFKNFHVHTYPNSKRICASTRIRIQSSTLPSRLLSRLVPIRRLSRPFSVNAFRCRNASAAHNNEAQGLGKFRSKREKECLARFPIKYLSGELSKCLYNTVICIPYNFQNNCSTECH